jgi:hypothetical protein
LHFHDTCFHSFLAALPLGTSETRKFHGHFHVHSQILVSLGLVVVAIGWKNRKSLDRAENSFQVLELMEMRLIAGNKV